MQRAGRSHHPKAPHREAAGEPRPRPGRVRRRRRDLRHHRQRRGGTARRGRQQERAKPRRLHDVAVRAALAAPLLLDRGPRRRPPPARHRRRRPDDPGERPPARAHLVQQGRRALGHRGARRGGRGPVGARDRARRRARGGALRGHHRAGLQRGRPASRVSRRRRRGEGEARRRREGARSLRDSRDELPPGIGSGERRMDAPPTARRPVPERREPGDGRARSAGMGGVAGHAAARIVPQQHADVGVGHHRDARPGMHAVAVDHSDVAVDARQSGRDVLVGASQGTGGALARRARRHGRRQRRVREVHRSRPTVSLARRTTLRVLVLPDRAGKGIAPPAGRGWPHLRSVPRRVQRNLFRRRRARCLRRVRRHNGTAVVHLRRRQAGHTQVRRHVAAAVHAGR